MYVVKGDALQSRSRAKREMVFSRGLNKCICTNPSALANWDLGGGDRVCVAQFKSRPGENKEYLDSLCSAERKAQILESGGFARSHVRTLELSIDFPGPAFGESVGLRK